MLVLIELFRMAVISLPLCFSLYSSSRTNVIANNSTNNNVVFFIVSDFKIVFYNNY